MRGVKAKIVAFLLIAGGMSAAGAVSASPMPPELTIDKTFGKVAGWSIGYSGSLRGCLAAATYADGTTIWFGLGGARGTSYLAFTNPKWRSIDVGEQYNIRILARGHGRWRGNFTGFRRDEARGLFSAGLKEGFVADLSNAGAISVEFEGRSIATLSLVGSTEAFDAVVSCQKESVAIDAKADGDGSSRKEESRGKSSQGTGFYVSEKGHVVTNNHVIDGCRDITVAHVGEPPMKARLVASDARNDLAVLATDARPSAFPPLSMRSRIGEAVYAFGFPLSGILATTGNFTIGNITATAGLGDDTRQIQVSAPLQPGNSGGPLLDQYGNVVGVIVSKLNALKMASITSDLAQNVNFAIKTTVVLDFLDANNITASIEAQKIEVLDGASLAERAKAFTVRVNCQ